jgi:small GTP-binding protein
MLETLRLKTVLIGDGRIGKTSLINRFVHGTFDEHTPITVGISFETARFRIRYDEREIDVTMTIWDCGGQKEYEDYIPAFSKGLDIAVYVFALHDRESFQNLSNWLKLVEAQKPNQLRFVVGTKLDLLWAQPDNYAVLGDEMDVFLDENNISAYFMSSSSYGINIVENFHQMTETFYREIKKSN